MIADVERNDDMIILTRLNGQNVAINPDLITWIEVTPDTTVSLVTGDKIVVREPLDDVIDKIVTFRRATHVPPATSLHLVSSQLKPRTKSHLRLSAPPTNEK